MGDINKKDMAGINYINEEEYSRPLKAKKPDGYTLLETGRYYKIKDSVKTKATERKVKYCGVDTYKGKKHHNFFDEHTRLFHWIKESDVEPCF